MNIKDIKKSIRRISNLSSLPVLCYAILSRAMLFLLYLILKVFLNIDTSTNTEIINLGAYFLLYLIVLPISLTLFYKLKGTQTEISLKSCFIKPERSVKWIIKWIVISLGITYLTTILSNLVVTILGLFGISINTNTIHLGGSPFIIFATTLFPLIMAPIFEELLFRGCIYKNTEPIGQLFAIIFSGLIFGLWHTNGVQSAYTFVFGIMTAFLFAKTRSILPSMILHFILNLIATIGSLFASGRNIGINEITTDNIIQIIVSLFIVLLEMHLIVSGLILFIIELVKHRKKLSLDRGIYDIKSYKKMLIFLTAPITLITLVLLVILTIFDGLQ